MNSKPSPAERVKAIGERAKAERARNRERMPETAKFLDEFRQHFGDPVWFRFTENGLTVEWGERPTWAR